MGILELLIVDIDDPDYKQSVRDFIKKEDPIDTVTLIKEKQMLADIFYMDDKYRDFFEHSAINYNLSKFNDYEEQFQSTSFEDSNRMVTDRYGDFVDELEDSGDKYLYYYIRQGILFEDREYSIYTKYRIDYDGYRSLIDILQIPRVFFEIVYKFEERIEL